MRSEGKNLDIFDHAPQNTAKAWRYAAEMASVDPHFTPDEQRERSAYYRAEAERLEAML